MNEKELLEAKLVVAQAQDIVLDTQKELNEANRGLVAAQETYNIAVVTAQSNLDKAKADYETAKITAETNLNAVKDGIKAKQEAYNNAQRALSDAQYIINKADIAVQIDKLQSTIASKEAVIPEE